MSPDSIIQPLNKLHSHDNTVRAHVQKQARIYMYTQFGIHEESPLLFKTLKPEAQAKEAHNSHSQTPKTSDFNPKPLHPEPLNPEPLNPKPLLQPQIPQIEGSSARPCFQRPPPGAWGQALQVARAGHPSLTKLGFRGGRGPHCRVSGLRV